MSNVNIRRAIENIRGTTTHYTPLVEIIVNAIQAIEETGRKDGEVRVRVLRSSQIEIDRALADIDSFEIEDNGIGFTESHRKSFDTLYSDAKIKEGGKGFGRFTCLKYFEDLRIRSVYREGRTRKIRSFSMGKVNDIIVNEKVATKKEKSDTGSVVTLDFLKKKGSFDKKLSTIARNLAERLLPYFITNDYVCPAVVLSEQDGSGAIRLNDFVSNELSAVIREIKVKNASFTIKGVGAEEQFLVRVFKFYAPKNQKSRIGLVAHKREVSIAPLHKYIPEFEEEFYDTDQHGQVNVERNYIVKAYVFGHYLDKHVSLERGGFDFEVEEDLIYGIAQTDIERAAALITKDAMSTDVTLRQEKKKAQVQSYVEQDAPWHRDILSKIDISTLPCNPSNEEIETRLQKEKFAQEIEIKRDVARLLTESNIENVQDVVEIVSKISGTSKNDLVHYIALRRKILDIFSKSLEVDSTGAYSAEGIVHDIIFPRKGNSDITNFKDHNLWILDERLNFTSYVASDVELNGPKTERPDLIVYNKRVLFRGDNEASNPITIFEFKKPQRDDFVNPSSKEDPVQQIVRYVIDIRAGKYKTPEGRKILVAPNTPFYGYVVCDLTTKVESWLEFEKDFKPMPDRLGWFHWMSSTNLYVEVISWDKVLKDAKMRNQVFFQKLGI